MENEKKYALRAPKFDDSFLLMKIIGKVGLKNVSAGLKSPDVQAAISGAGEGGEEATKTVGIAFAMEMGGIVLENMESAQKEIYAFLSRLSGLEVQEIAELSLADAFEMLVELFKMEEFRDFFTAAMQLLNREK